MKETKEKKSNKEKKKRRRSNDEGLRIARYWRKGIFSVIFSPLIFVLLWLIFQMFFLLILSLFFGVVLENYIIGGETVIELMVLVYLFNCRMDSTAKLSWMLLISAMPYLGTLFYLWTKIEVGHRKVKKKLNKLTKETKTLLVQDKETIKELKSESHDSAALAQYLYKIDNCPVYSDTDVEYYPLGDDKFPAMLEEIEKAEKFIFLEYFIIEEGYMWGKILEALVRKAKCGVDVRVMYDGTCDFSTLPYYYPRRLAKFGIKCKRWEPIKPVVTSSYNYRDHRKILVIDGKVGFCGGVNLADEYINHIERFGHWKDTAVKLTGPAVDSLTLMFLQMWNVKEKEHEDFTPYFNHYERQTNAKGYVIPYAESPLNNNKIAERVYMDILYTAQNYVYIMTPYLVLDDELSTALCHAAERGVDVRLILPGIPDKKAVYDLAKRHYKRLVDSGVKIYEYTPGFVHAKVFLSDDIKAVVGTINLDYRSLYHHFECAVYMHGVSCIGDIKKDFRYTFDKCRKVTYDTIKHESIVVKVVGAVLKLFAPLL